MKKAITIFMALLMSCSLAACSIQVRAAEEVHAEKVANALSEVMAALPEPPEKTYEELSIDEKLELKASELKETKEAFDSGMLAPAQDAATKLWGYINSKGEWVIKPEYDHAYQFKEQMAPVLDSNKKYHIITTDGALFTSQVGRNSIDSATHFSEGYAAVGLGVGYEQSKVYLSDDGSSEINASSLPVTSGIKYQSRVYFAIATPFVNGKAVTMRRTNASVIEAHNNDRALVARRSYYQSPSVIDTEGNVLALLPKGYDIMDYSLDENGIIIVKDMTQESEPYGLCDAEGKVTAECKFTRIEHSQGELYLACDENGFWGFIDKYGNTKVDFRFHAAYPFSSGLAAVCEDTYWGAINESGEYVIAPEWNEFAPLYCSHQDYGAGNAAFAEGVAAARRGAYWALIDSKGNILDCTYAPGVEFSPYKSVSGGFVVYEAYTDGVSSGSCGLLDLNGNVCLPGGRFLSIGLFNDEKHPA